MILDRQEDRTRRRIKKDMPVIQLGTASRATRGVLPGICDVAIGMPMTGLQRD